MTHSANGYFSKNTSSQQTPYDIPILSYLQYFFKTPFVLHSTLQVLLL